MGDEERIVANGRDRLVGTPEFEAARRRILEEAESRFSPLIDTAGLFGRLRIKREKSRWIREQLEEVAPSGALYLHR